MDNSITMRRFTWKAALKLEIAGMKRSRSPSVYSIVKSELGSEAISRKCTIN